MESPVTDAIETTPVENRRRVFISYSHDTDAHKAWVRELAEFLTTKGVVVLLDQWELDFGDDLPSFMEQGVRDTDRVLVICTNNYIKKANTGSGGVGYERTIITAEILKNPKDRRKFIPIVRNVTGVDKLPTFFGAAYYLDLSDDSDHEALKEQLLQSINRVAPQKPPLGAIAYLAGAPMAAPSPAVSISAKGAENSDRTIAFSDRFSQAFPGLRGIQWLEDADTIAERLGILLKQPLNSADGHIAGWWRGPSNLHIDRFEHIESSHFLMGIDELNIRRIAAVYSGSYFRKFLYVETVPDEPTGLYPQRDIANSVQEHGYADEEYGLVDENLPVTRAEYDDKAAIIDGKPVDIQGRVELRARFITPYNFVIAPLMSPINNGNFDYEFEAYLNKLLQGENVFDEMVRSIFRLPRRDN